MQKAIQQILIAAAQHLPIPVELVDLFGVALPDGYLRESENYVWKGGEI